jgi:hypothetical protein
MAATNRVPNSFGVGTPAMKIVRFGTEQMRERVANTRPALPEGRPNCSGINYPACAKLTVARLWHDSFASGKKSDTATQHFGCGFLNTTSPGIQSDSFFALISASPACGLIDDRTSATVTFTLPFMQYALSNCANPLSASAM